MTVRKPREFVFPPTPEHVLARWKDTEERRRHEFAERCALEVQLHCANRDGFSIWASSLRDRLLTEARANMPKRCHTDASDGKTTLNTYLDPAALAARIRALAVQNDPDAVRDELEAIAATLEGM